MIIMKVVHFCVVKFLRIIRAAFSNITSVPRKSIQCITYKALGNQNIVQIDTDSEDELEPYDGCELEKRVSFSPSTARREFEKDIESHSTNPFLNFLMELRIQMHRKKASAPFITKEAGVLWRNMSKDEKLPYVVFAHKKKQLLAERKVVCSCKSKTSLKRLSRVHLGRKCRNNSSLSSMRKKSSMLCVKKRSSTANNLIA